MCNRRIMMMVAGVALLLGIGSARAQNESGRRSINKTRFQQLGYWYDSSTARFQTPYPIIRSLPPINSGMPWDILAAYVYMDSLARFDKGWVAETRLDVWRTSRTINDTLRGMAKYLYKLVDFNPIIFTQYIDEVSLKNSTKYSGSLRSIASQVGSTLYDGLSEAERRAGILALLEAGYILRVRVNAIDSMLSGSSEPTAKYIYRVTADVIDTLKGHAFVSCPQLGLSKDITTTRTIAAAPNPCMQFIYVKGLYSDPRQQPSGAPLLYTTRDPEFATGPDSLFAMRVGQEAVVFLRHSGWRVDSTHDYYHVRLEDRASFGALPIINGRVRDVNRIWSNDVMLDYDDWKHNFMMLRDRLLAGTY